MLLDTGASVCLLPESAFKRFFPRGKVLAWTGGPLASFHDEFQVVGEFASSIRIGENTFAVRWCIVRENVEAVLGLNFIEHYGVGYNWSKDCFEAVFENSLVEFPAYKTTDLRTAISAVIKPGHGMYIPCKLHDNSRIGPDSNLMVEPSLFTKGSLRTMSGVTRPEDTESADSQVFTFIANFGMHEVSIREGALVGHATPVDVCNPENIPGVKGAQSGLSYSEFKKGSDKESVENAVVGDSLTEAERKKVFKFLRSRARTFATNPKAPATYSGPPASINTGNARPVKEPLRRCNPIKAQEIARQVKEMLDDGIISPSKSPWSSPVVLAKKSDGTWRFCVDYRGLNRVTKKDAYPLPPMDAILNALGIETAILWSTIDAASGFWQIHIIDMDKEKTAFTTMYGHYQFNVVPFGLHGAPAAFCRAMDQTLRDLLWKVCLVFVDDIVVWGKDVDDHIQNLSMVFDALDRDGFTLKLSKCRFFMKEIRYLGHVISEGTIKMDPDKVKAIIDMSPPTKLKELRSFLGMIGWYQRFIEGYHLTAKPLEAKLSDKDESSWTMNDPSTEQGKAFLLLKEQLVKFPILRMPDWNKKFYLITDASDVGCGAILAQEHDGYELPVAFFSKTWKPSELQAPSYVKETRALVKSLKYFRHYFWGVRFYVVTDCRALAHWNSVKEISALVERYLSFIGTFDFVLFHRPGTLIPVSDSLSRLQLTEGRIEYRCSNKTPPEKMPSASVRAAMVLGISSSDIRQALENNRFVQKIRSYLETGKFHLKASKEELQEREAC
eukprot:TRINITY_DN199_c1_g1_i12.p1 TRINITY_DN199_c1_g1~~TRINITY_DN199_c1_g1_i12.p1  ORF type:complete len:782 (+),score=83.41 TRINITY_DN199_c1_g1_i12:1258-3603(+)